MRYAHAFWSEPLLHKKFMNYDDAVKINLVNYATSVALIHKNGYEIDLYTDNIGKEFFDQIPYDNVYVLNNRISNYHFAASFKFEALQHMQLGDALIDGDILIQKPEAFKLIENKNPDILVSFFEPNSYLTNYQQGIAESNIEMLKQLHKIDFGPLYNVPEDLSKCEGWHNTSLIKITNQELKNIWINQYYENLAKIPEKILGNYWPDCVLEQYNLTRLAEEYQFLVEPLIKGFPRASSNEYSLKIGYTHIGSIKKQYHNTCINILFNADKELFNKINNTVNDKINFIKSYGKI